MLEFRYDTQLLIEGENLDEDAINDYFVEHFKGDCLLAVGDEELIKGSVYLFYGRDPAWGRAHRVTGRATIINPDGTVAEVDDLKGLEADLNSLADGLSSMVVSSSDGVDSVVVNGQSVKYWKNLAKKYSANEPEPKTSAEQPACCLQEC